MVSEEAQPAKSLTTYEQAPTFKYAMTVGAQSAVVGTVVAAVQNALGTHNRGAIGLLTRYGGTIGFFAAAGFTFAATESFVANTRETKDPVNAAVGGCAAGFLAGLRAHSLPVAVGSCAFLGAALGTYESAGRLAGEKRDGDSPESWEERRKKFFKQKPATEIPTNS